MTIRLLLLVALLAAPAAPAVAAAAAPATAAPAAAPAKTLRTITWDLLMAVGTERRIQTSGIGSAGSGTSSDGAGAESKGTIVVDVVAVAPEGIVVDVAENASGRARPKVRVAITNAGALTYDPRQAQNVTEEETVVLHTLARGFLGDETSPGASWNVDGSGNGVTELEHYRVLSKADSQVSLDYKMESSAKGVNAFNLTRLGSIVYDAKYVVPVTLHYQEIVLQDRPGTSDRTTTSVDLKLASDTFKKT